jgi:hypothetical protein
VTVYDVLDADGFVVKTFATLEEAEAEVRATQEQHRKDYPDRVAEGITPWLNIRRREAGAE